MSGKNNRGKKMENTRIIFDNGGGITMQLNGWSHFYNGREPQLAEDIMAWVDAHDTSDWEGHEEDALEIDPTDDEIRSRGYRIIEIYEDDTLKEITERIGAMSFGRSSTLLVEALQELHIDR